MYGAFRIYRKPIIAALTVLIAMICVFSLHDTHLHPKADANVGTMTFFADMAHIQDGGDVPFDSTAGPGNDTSPTNQIVRSYDTVTVPLTIALTPTQTASSYTVTVKGYIDGGISHTNGVTRDVAYVEPQSSKDTYKEDPEHNRTTFTQVITFTNLSTTSYMHIKTLGAFNGTQFTPVITSATFSAAGNNVATNPTPTKISNLGTYTISSQVGVADTFDAYDHKFTTQQAPVNVALGSLHYFGLPFLAHGSNDKTGVGMTLPTEFSYTQNYSANLNYDTSQGTLQPLTLDSSNFTVLGSEGTLGTDNLTNISSEVSRQQLNTTTSQVTVSNINMGLINLSGDIYSHSSYDDNDQLVGVSGDYVDFTNNYTLGGSANPNSIPNNIQLSDTIDLAWMDGWIPHTQTSANASNADTDSWNLLNQLAGNAIFNFQSAGGIYSATIGQGGVTANGVLIGDTGSHVKFSPRVNAKLSNGSIIPTYQGGYDILYKFNPNSFNCTEADALAMSNIYNMRLAQNSGATIPDGQQFGVLKSTIANPNNPKTIYDAGKDDYAWYPNVAVAMSYGTISAVMLSNHVPYTPVTNNNAYMDPLILTDIAPLGTTDSLGNPNTVALNFYVYPDESSKTPSEEYSYNLINNQEEDAYKSSLSIKPDGTHATDDVDGARFGTAQFLEAGIENESAPNKYTDASVYGSQSTMTVNTTASDLIISSLVGDKKYPIEIDYYLNPGVRYVPHSANVALPANTTNAPAWTTNPSTGQQYTFKLWQDYQNDPTFNKEPIITTGTMYNWDGTSQQVQVLKWHLSVSRSELTRYETMGQDTDTPGNLPAMTFNTTFDDSVIPYVNQSYTFDADQSYFSVDLPSSPTLDSFYLGSLKLDTVNVTVNLKSGPGASNSLDANMGYPGANFTVTTKPYTTDASGDADMVGIIPVPSNSAADTKMGTHFNGSLTLNSIIVDGGTAGHKIDIYYLNYPDDNKQYNDPNPLTDTNPNDVKTSDTSKWHLYVPGTSDLSHVADVYYHVEGTVMPSEHATGSRSPSIAMTFQTAGNKPGDTYVNQSYVNAPQYMKGGTNNSNKSTYIAYTVVDNRFSGTVWNDLNKNGLIDTDESKLSGIHVRLLKYNTATSAYELAGNYDPDLAKTVDTGAVTDSNGDYKLIASSDGQYVVGISKADLDKRGQTLTLPDVDSGSSSDSHFNPNQTDALVDGYYISTPANTLPAPADITQSDYYFDNINAGLIDQFGGLSIQTPDLYFGKHSLPSTQQTYSNQPLSGTGTPDNTVYVTDTREHEYAPYHVSAELSDFVAANDQSTGLQKAFLSYIDNSNLENPTVNVGVGSSNEQDIFNNTASLPNVSPDKKFDDIRLTVPTPNAVTNLIKPATYKATVTYSLVNGPS